MQVCPHSGLNCPSVGSTDAPRAPGKLGCIVLSEGSQGSEPIAWDSLEKAKQQWPGFGVEAGSTPRDCLGAGLVLWSHTCEHVRAS